MACDVCEKNLEIGVACVPGLPISVAYCQQCLNANAHPWWTLVAGTALNNGLENCADYWKKMVQDTCVHLGRTLEEFNQDVQKDLDKLAAL